MSHTFTGGVIPDYSELQEKFSVTSVDPASVTLRIPNGYTVRVTDGEHVCIGTVIADGDGAAVVCGISGAASVSDNSVTVVNDRMATPCPDLHPAEKPISVMTAEELQYALQRAGVPIPQFPQKKPIECMIADCCERDTDSISVASTLLDRAEAVAGGLRILMKLAGTARGYLAIPRHMRACAEELSGYADGRLVRIASVSDKYPQYQPHMLVSALFNLEINPLNDTGRSGYPVVTAEACAAAFDALANGIPYTSSRITVSGGGMIPGVYTVPFGSEIIKLPALCGCTDEGIIYTGGRFTRKAVTDGEFTDRGIFSVTVGKKMKEKEPHECTSCGRCTAVCPIKLIPPLIYGCDNAKKASRFGAQYCISCGCCDSICPAELELRTTILHFAEEIKKEGTT